MNPREPSWKDEHTSVTDTIAEDWWQCISSTGTAFTVHIRVGRPRQVPGETDWYCPIQQEGADPNPDPSWWSDARPGGMRFAMGSGPVDALSNAMTLLKSLYEGVEWVPCGGKLPSASKSE